MLLGKISVVEKAYVNCSEFPFQVIEAEWSVTLLIVKLVGSIHVVVASNLKLSIARGGWVPPDTSFLQTNNKRTVCPAYVDKSINSST